MNIATLKCDNDAGDPENKLFRLVLSYDRSPVSLVFEDPFAPAFYEKSPSNS